MIITYLRIQHAADQAVFYHEIEVIPVYASAAADRMPRTPARGADPRDVVC